MALSEKLEYLISMDPQAGIAGVRTFASEVDKSLTGVESRVSRTGATLTKLGAGGIGVGGFLTQIASGDIEASNQLRAAIDATGHSIDEYRGRINDAVAAQVKFGNTDEEVSNAVRILTQSYGDTDKALDRLQVTSDLAAAKHISLADAASLVARAHGGAGRVFKEFGIEVQTNADGTKNYDAALDQLSGKLSGQASAAADSYGGKLRELRAVIANAASTLGQEYGPTILAVSAATTAAGTIASGAAALHARLATAQAATAAAAEAQAAAETEAAAAEALLTTNSSAAVASLYAQDAALATTGAAFGPWGAAVAGGILVVSEAWDILGSKEDHAAARTRDVQNALGQSAAGITSMYTELLAEGNTEDAPKFLEGLESAGQAGIGALTKLRDGLKATGADTSAVDAAIQAATAAQLEYASATSTGASALGQEDAATKKVEQSQRQLLSNTREAFTAQRSYEQAQQGVISALRSVEQAQESVAEAQERLNKAMQPASAEDLGKANLDITDAQDRAADSAKTLADEQTRLDKIRAKGIATPAELEAEERKVSELASQHQRDVYAVADAEKHLQDVQKRGTSQDQAVIDARKNLASAEDNVRDAMSRVADAEANRAEAAAQLLNATNALKDGGLSNRDAINDQITAYTQLKDTLAPNSELRKNIEDYINRLILLRALTGTSLQDEIDAITSNISDFQRQFAQGDVRTPGRAVGGPVTAGRTYRVGEYGEELFTPWTSGFITPHQAARAGDSSLPVVHLSQIVREDVADDAMRGVNKALMLNRR